jgi:hypothetical protein
MAADRSSQGMLTPPAGPREVSINRPSAIRPIYEPPTQTTRSPWYAQVSNDVTKISLNSTRVLSVHKQRKKGWERGLGSRGESCQGGAPALKYADIEQSDGDVRASCNEKDGQFTLKGGR